MKRSAIVVALALGLMAQGAMAKTLNVVSSFSVLGDIAQQVGGEHVHVDTLVGPDGDPHTFEPSPKDSALLSKADVVVVNGLGLEGWLDRLIKASGFKGELVVASKGVKTHTLDEEGKTVTDPHAWNSAANGALYAQNILEGLVKADPEDKAALTSSGKRYIDQLTSLDGWAKAQFSAIPLAKRKVLTSHDAFGYFGRAYHVTFLAPQGLSSESEASAAQVAALIKQIKADGVHTWFMENQLDPRLVKQIASATGAQPGGELYPEALSKPDGVADSYVKMMRHNVELIANSMKYRLSGRPGYHRTTHFWIPPRKIATSSPYLCRKWLSLMASLSGAKRGDNDRFRINAAKREDWPGAEGAWGDGDHGGILYRRLDCESDHRYCRQLGVV